MNNVVCEFDGGQGGILFLYEDKVIVRHKGILKKYISNLEGDKAIPLSNISTVDFNKCGLFSVGYIHIFPHGVVKSKKYVSTEDDENKIFFTVDKNEKAEEIVNLINKALQNIKSSSNAEKQVTPVNQEPQLSKENEKSQKSGSTVKNIITKVSDFVKDIDSVDVSHVIEKTNKAINKYMNNKTQKTFDVPSDTQILAIAEDQYEWGDEFGILDKNMNVKYVVIGNFSLTREFYIYDNKGKKVGRVTRKMLAFRSPLSIDSSPVNVEIELKDKVLGMVKSMGSASKRKYKVQFKGWLIEGNFLGHKYKILEKKKLIASVDNSLFNWMGYIATFKNPEDEIYVLLLMTALQCLTGKSRGDKFKHVARNKFL